MLSKWIPSREERYDELKRKRAILDTQNGAEVSNFSELEKNFIKVAAVRPEFGPKTFFLVVLKKPVPIMEFSRIIHCVEGDLIEVARKTEEEEKARRG